MPTTLFLTDISTNYKNVVQYYLARTTAGTAATTAVIGGAGITVDSQWTKTSGGEFVQWLSPPIARMYNQTWTASNSLNTARRALASAGTQTASAAFGGLTASVVTQITEEYDGNTWSAGGNLATARQYLAGCGLQTACLAIGGSVNPSSTEVYDGTSWVAGGNLGTGRQRLAAAGSTTEGLAFGGYTNVSVFITEEYNGTSWSAGGNLATARQYLAGCGSQNAGLSMGGSPSGSDYSTVTEEYNGVSWASSGSLGNLRYGLSGSGEQLAALSTGGLYGVVLANTEEYDGFIWSNSKSLITARLDLSGSGTTSDGLTMGGFSSSVTGATEEYSVTLDTYLRAGGNETTNHWAFETNASFNAGVKWTVYRWRYDKNTNTITETPFLNFDNATELATTSTVRRFTTSFSRSWSTKLSMNNARQFAGSAGSSSATDVIVFGGSTNISTNINYTSSTEEYNGTSWYTGGNLSAARGGHAGCGTLTAGLSMGGSIGDLTTSNAANGAVTEEYNGDTWSAGGNLATGRYFIAGCGTQTAGLSVGGWATAQTNTTEEYDGSSWSSGGAYPVSRIMMACVGTQTAAASIGGCTNRPSGGSTPNASAGTFNYDGSTWSAGVSYPVVMTGLAACGSQTDIIATSGYNSTVGGSGVFAYGGYTGTSYEFNQNSWSVGGTLVYAAAGKNAAGTRSSAIAFGGSGAVVGGVANLEQYQSDIEFIAGDRIAFKAFLTQVGILNSLVAPATINYGSPTNGTTGDTNFTLSPTFKFKKHLTNFS